VASSQHVQYVQGPGDYGQTGSGAHIHRVSFNQLSDEDTMQTEHLKVTGMTCGGCASKVAHALEIAPGVNNVKVSLSPGEATVRYDERVTSSNRLKSVVESAGYGVDVNDTHNPKSKGGCCS